MIWIRGRKQCFEGFKILIEAILKLRRLASLI